MRSDSFRLHRALSTVVLSLSIAAFGCGDDSQEDGTTTDANATVPAKATPTTPTPATSSPVPPTSSASPSNSNDAGAPAVPATTPSTPGVTPPVPPPTTCTAESAKETESNDTAETAQDLGAATTFCGSVDAGDIDHAFFTMPADAKAFAYKASWSGLGEATVALSVEGVTPEPGKKLPLQPGKKYVFKVTGAKAKNDYVIALAISR